MDYIYAELDSRLLLSTLKVYYGFTDTTPTALPSTIYECTDYSHLESEGYCIQDITVPATDTAKKLVFAYPKAYGDLDHIYNDVYDVISTWEFIDVSAFNTTYRLYYTYKKKAPGMTSEYKFVINKENENG